MPSRSDITAVINMALTATELVIRWRNQQPYDFEDQKEALELLIERTEKLKEKPEDYLQQWRPND